MSLTKILAIDDEYHILQLISEFLREHNFEVTTAPNGKIALECLKSYSPDLILCDVEMPELNGYQFLEKLKQQPHLSQIPFLFLTGMSQRQHQRQGMDLGADDYLTKPFTFQELLKATQVRLAKFKSIQNLIQEQVRETRETINLIDETTGLPNMAGLQKNFWNCLQKHQHLALLSFRLDHFEQKINQQNTALGRVIMKAVASRLSQYFIPEQNKLYYLGLNEFGLLLQIENPQNLLQSFQFLEQQLNQGFTIMKRHFSFEISAGIAMYPHNATCFESLVVSSKSACDKAQTLGGAQCQFVI